jgi:hypothetical protein
MKNLFFYLFLFVHISFYTGCKKDTRDNEQGFIIASKTGNLSFVKFSPPKIIETSKITVAKGDVFIDSIVGGSFELDLNNDGLEDLIIISGINSSDNKSVVRLHVLCDGFSFNNYPIKSGDTINNSQQWIELRNDVFVNFPSLDSTSNKWIESAYFGYRIRNIEFNYIYGWINLKISNSNKIEIYALSNSF